MTDEEALSDDDDDDIEVVSMVEEALSAAKLDVAEKYAHTSCIHAANVGPPASTAD